MRSDIAPGGVFTDFEPPGHENIPRKLSELQGDDPLILSLADRDPMIPHTLVLNHGLVIHSIYNGYWFWGRPRR
jgi:hypothetical protein